MACAHPLTTYNKYLNKTFKIPCNRCINCRVDKRNMWSDRVNYSLSRDYFYIGAFVTFTYDEYHLLDPSLTGSCHYTNPEFSPDGKSYVTLDKNDVKKLLNRIRSYMDYHKIDNKLLRRDFKFLAVSEYGGEYGRPHTHILFLGLDWVAAKPIFEKCWKSGIVDCRPILDGGINYVLKYLDKQLYDDQKFDTYEQYNIQPPFKSQSPNLGVNLYLDAISSGFALQNNNCYPAPKNSLRPIPSYYKKKYIQCDNRYYIPDPTDTIFSYNSSQPSHKQKPLSTSYLDFDLRKYNEYRARLKEIYLTEYCRRKNSPVNDPLSYSEISQNGQFYILNSDVPRVPNSWKGVIDEISRYWCP